MNSYNEAKAMFNTRKRKLQNNTYLVQTENGFGVKLHDTIVVEYLPDRTILNSGGWKTTTTKNRINEYMPIGYIYQNKGVWYIGQSDVVFQDGCYCQDGKWYNVGHSSKAINKQRKACRKYAKDFTKAMFSGKVDQPGPGDCFYCGMVTVDDKQPLGEALKNKDHIESHIKENYFVPSLLVNACKMFGVSNAAWWTIQEIWQKGKAEGCFADVGRRQIESAIRRYCYRQLGLAS